MVKKALVKNQHSGEMEEIPENEMVAEGQESDGIPPVIVDPVMLEILEIKAMIKVLMDRGQNKSWRDGVKK